jgi:hypothetical protein
VTTADPGRRVDVSGGKGVLVGDYGTIVQIFAAAPAPLASQIRTREFGTLVEERTRDFVGRQFVFDAVETALADETFPSGYLVVRGEPGIGKTAVLAGLVKRYGWVHHFTSAPQGIRSAAAFLANVCAQLIVRYGLDHPALPPEATRDGGFLARLLAEAATGTEPVVVVVDALDEADPTGTAANRLFLPPDLPPNVYFVVSTRETADPELFVRSRRDIPLRDDDPRNIEDIRAYLAIHADSLPGTAVDELLGKSDGNFMYVVHILRDIASGALTMETVDDVRRLPHGLKAYYQRHWREMRSGDPERFGRYQEPVLCLLATAREPVAAERLVEWTGRFWQERGWDTRQLTAFAVRDVLTEWEQFLHVDDRHYRIYHASFADFLADEVGLAGYHETIGMVMLAKIPGFLTGE